MTTNFQMLDGKKVTLKSFDESCVTDEYISWLNDPEVVRYSGQRFRHHTRETSLEYLDSFKGTQNLFVAVHLRDSRQMVGTLTAYTSEQNGTADIGILIGDKTHWGKGVGLDAWQTLMNYFLDDRCVRKVTGGTVRCNAGMVRIMSRSGMTLEAVKVNQQIIDGNEQDELYFAKFRC